MKLMQFVSGSDPIDTNPLFQSINHASILKVHASTNLRAELSASVYYNIHRTCACCISSWIFDVQKSGWVEIKPSWL